MGTMMKGKKMSNNTRTAKKEALALATFTRLSKTAGKVRRAIYASLNDTRLTESQVNVLELLGYGRLPVRTDENCQSSSGWTTPVIAYINYMGGTRSSNLAKWAIVFWEWALEKGIVLRAPGWKILWQINVQGDYIYDRTDWQLNPKIFSKINILWGDQNHWQR